MTEIAVSLSRLSAKDNPRLNIKDTTGLQDSIAAVGLINPLTVFETDKKGWYAVVSGGRRLVALRALNREKRRVPDLDFRKVPCRVIDKPVDEDGRLVIMVAANSQEKLTPSDTGKALKKLMLGKRWTLVKTAKAWGIKPTRARVLLSLAEADPKVQRKVDKGEISLTAYSKLASAPPAAIEEAIEREGKVTVVQAEKIIADTQVDDEALEGLVVHDEPDIVALLSGIKVALRKIAGLPALGIRERHILDEIRDLLNE